MSPDDGSARRVEVPRLRHCTFLRPPGATRMTMIVGRECFEIAEEVGALDDFLRVKSHFDGRHRVEEIAALTGVSEDAVRAIASSFDGLGLLRRAEPLDRVPAARLVDLIEAAAVMWRRQIGYHRLFRLLAGGEAGRRVFVGLLIETYHYVKAASEHISVAVAHCADDRWRELLVRYLVDEHDHSGLVAKALANAGVDPDHLATAHPTIGTTSLVHMLEDVGRRSTLAYLACTTLFEASVEDHAAAKASFERMAVASGVDPSAVAPVVEHLAGDVAAGHASLLRQALADRDAVDAAVAHDVVNRMHDLKHAFDQYHDGVLQYYGDISNYVPRVRVDYFAL